MPLSPLYTCSKCKREFSFKNIKYDLDHSLICSQCLERKQKVTKKVRIENAPEEEKQLNFICTSCRFKFSFKKSSPRELKCPYCCKKKIMLIKKYKNEDDLIRESADPKFDY